MNTWATAELANIFNAKQLNWLGLVTQKPITEDYVPLLPWLGVMWWGVAAGTWLTRQGAALTWPLPAALKPLALLGRWSLSYYMHQPVMIGASMPMLISSACAGDAGTAQKKLTFSDRVSNTIAHQIELVVSMSAAIKKARRCGAAKSHLGREGGAPDGLGRGRSLSTV